MTVRALRRHIVGPRASIPGPEEGQLVRAGRALPSALGDRRNGREAGGALTCAASTAVCSALESCRRRGYSWGTTWKIWFTVPAFIYFLCFKKPGDFKFLLKSQSIVIPLMRAALGQMVPLSYFWEKLREGKDYTLVLFRKYSFPRT